MEQRKSEVETSLNIANKQKQNLEEKLQESQRMIKELREELIKYKQDKEFISMEVQKREWKLLKNLPKLVQELESKKNKEEFEEHTRNKQLYGQPMT